MADKHSENYTINKREVLSGMASVIKKGDRASVNICYTKSSGRIENAYLSVGGQK